jgi:predicted ribosomally synthesized peptide with SipW-like signal peptide
MKRTILVSLLVVGAALALLAGGATFAPFTDTDSDSGDVAAGTVDIEVLGTGTLDFSAGDPGCPAAMAPGDTCGPDTVTITNNGSLSVTLSDPAVTYSGDLSTCDGGGKLSASTSAQSYTADVTVLDPTDTATFDISATLDSSAGDDCQGATGTVTVAVTATNS